MKFKILLVFFSLFMFSSAANAKLVNFRYEAVITEVNDRSFPGYGIAVGDTVRGVVIYDTTTPADRSGSNYADYKDNNSESLIIATVNGITFTPPEGFEAPLDIHVWVDEIYNNPGVFNNQLDFRRDYEAVVSGDIIGSNFGYMGLANHTKGSPISFNPLPDVIPEFEGSNDNGVSVMFMGNDELDFLAELTSITPYIPEVPTCNVDCSSKTGTCFKIEVSDITYADSDNGLFFLDDRREETQINAPISGCEDFNQAESKWYYFPDKYLAPSSSEQDELKLTFKGNNGLNITSFEVHSDGVEVQSCSDFIPAPTSGKCIYNSSATDYFWMDSNSNGQCTHMTFMKDAVSTSCSFTNF